MQSIRRLGAFRNELDDHARRGDLSFAHKVRASYATRVRQTTKMLTELAGEPHDFSRDESFETHPEGFPADTRALRDRCRKKVKYDLLVERQRVFDESPMAVFGSLDSWLRVVLFPLRLWRFGSRIIH